MSEQGASGRHGPPPIVRAAIVLTVIGIGGGTWFAARNGYVSLPGIARAAPTIGSNRIAVSGTIESEESTITAEVSGRLVGFDVRDGDSLKVGQLIARIEDPVIAAQVSQAQASVGVAEANLALLRAGTRPEDVRATEAARDASRAQLATAQAQVATAQVAVTNAEALRAQPQELDARIHQARVAQEVAVARLAQLEAGGRDEDIATATATLGIAQVRLAQLEAGGRAEEVASASAALAVARTRLAQVEAGGRAEDVTAATGQLEVARTRLSQLEAGARSEERARANAVVDASRAQLAAATNRLAQVEAGARTPDIRAGQAAVDQAQTRLEQVRDGTPRGEDIDQVRLAYEAADAAYGAAGDAETDARTTFDAATRLRDNRPPSMSADQVNLSYAQAQQAWRAAQANREQRRIARDVSRAALEKALNGPTPWERRLAEEALDQARAQLQRLQDVNPFDVRTAQSQVDAARAQLAQAEAAASAIAVPTEFDRAVAALGVSVAEAQRDRVANPTSFDVDAARGAVAQAEAALAIRQHPNQDRDLEIARLGVRQAEEALAIRRKPATDRDLEIARLAVKQADAQVRDLETLREQPLAATAQVDLARAQLEAARTTVIGAEAALAGAEARLDGARQGATATQIGVAEAQLAQARAAAKVLEAQASKGTVLSPRAGTIVRAIAHLGETVTPGTPLVVWHDASDLTLTAYVGEMDIGRVKETLPVTITADSLPGETYKGTVRTISTRAEFTPRNVQVARDRVNLVYAVKVTVSDASGRLKAGMPVDAVIDIEALAK